MLSLVEKGIPGAVAPGIPFFAVHHMLERFLR
jgi:hypothetical protein